MFTQKENIKYFEDSWVEFKKFSSGVTAARLAAKKSMLFALYGKANIVDRNEEHEIDLKALRKGEEIALEHDMLKLQSAIVSWKLPVEAFVKELDDREYTPNILEYLRQEVFAEINRLIDKVYKENDLDEIAKKNAIKPLINFPSEPSRELATTATN